MTQDAPENWTWGFGEWSENSYYDYWAYQNDGEYELHQWWDEGQQHKVEIIPINGYDENGDPNYGYEQDIRGFDTEEEADEYAQELMEKYQ